MPTLKSWFQPLKYPNDLQLHVLETAPCVRVAVTVALAGIACANLMYGSLKGAFVGAAVVGGAGGAAVVVCGGRHQDRPSAASNRS